MAVASWLLAVPASGGGAERDPYVVFTFGGDWDVVDAYGQPASRQPTRERTSTAAWRVTMGLDLGSGAVVRLSDLRRYLVSQRGKGESTFPLSYSFAWRSGRATYTVKDIRPGRSCEEAGARRAQGAFVVGDRVVGQTIVAFTAVASLFAPPLGAGLCSSEPEIRRLPWGTWSWEPPFAFTPRSDGSWIVRRQEFAWFPIDVPRLARSGFVTVPVSFKYQLEQNGDLSISHTWEGDVTARLK